MNKDKITLKLIEKEFKDSSYVEFVWTRKEAYTLHEDIRDVDTLEDYINDNYFVVEEEFEEEVFTKLVELEKDRLSQLDEIGEKILEGFERIL